MVSCYPSSCPPPTNPNSSIALRRAKAASSYAFFLSSFFASFFASFLDRAFSYCASLSSFLRSSSSFSLRAISSSNAFYSASSFSFYSCWALILAAIAEFFVLDAFLPLAEGLSSSSTSAFTSVFPAVSASALSLALSFFF